MATSLFHPAARDMTGWWKQLDPAGSDGFAIDVQNVMRAPGCTITHVDLHEQPHRVSFEPAHPTLLIYDATTYLNGEREIDGATARRSGPMGDSVDVIPAGVRFEGRADRGSRIGCTLVTIDPDAQDSPDEAWKEMAASLRPALGLKNRLVSALGERLRTYARFGSCGLGTAYLEGAALLLLHEVCGELKIKAQARHAEPRAGSLSPWAQRKILDYLQENLDQKVDLDALAAQVRLSRFHFSRAFKRTFGVPPCNYLMQLRIARACELLRDSGRSITDVALDLGFPTSAEFARAFRNAMNCTPREFRQRC